MGSEQRSDWSRCVFNKIVLASESELQQSKCWEGCKEGTAIVQAKEDGGSGQEGAMRGMRRGCILDIC